MNDRDQRDQTIAFINNFQKAFLEKKSSGIRINFENLEEIDPEAALALLAEIDRCKTYLPQKKVFGSRPPNVEVNELLHEIGFFSYFNADFPYQKTGKKRIYTKVECGTKTNGELVGKLIQEFEKIRPFSPALRRFLYEALIECMDNVNWHAYKQVENEKELPQLHGNWWILGYCDQNFEEISFTIYDQGSGIPATLKTKWSGFFTEDHEYITEAIREGKSRLKNVRRGNGLPKIARLMDKAPLGQLFVHSNKAYNLFQSVEGQEEDVSFDAKEHLQGTLVTLKILRQPNDTLSLLIEE